MHASQLAEIGSWAAVHSDALVFGFETQPEVVAASYWTASRSRLTSWLTALKLFETDLANEDSEHDPWPAIETVVQEILVSEMLTRVWSAAVIAHDSFHETDELSGLAHSIHVSHLECRNRALRMVVAAEGSNPEAFERIDRVRRKMRRWTDLFLSQIPDLDAARTFAFDAARVQDFFNEQREIRGREYEQRQKILLASFAADMQKIRCRYAAQPDLNRRISGGVLQCFPSDRFDSLGIPKSMQMFWMEKSQDDTQVLVDQLFEFEQLSDGHDDEFVSPNFRI